MGILLGIIGVVVIAVVIYLLVAAIDIISAKTTTAVTFEIYNLVAVSSAQTVPVDYSCAV